MKHATANQAPFMNRAIKKGYYEKIKTQEQVFREPYK